MVDSRKSQVSQLTSEEIQDERYDRMNRKDFSRKPNTFAPVLLNDGYSNFRFSKRAGEILSPLSKTKFGLNLKGRSRLRTIDSKYRSDFQRSSYNESVSMNRTSYSKFEKQSLRGKSTGTKKVLPNTQQNFNSSAERLELQSYQNSFQTINTSNK